MSLTKLICLILICNNISCSNEKETEYRKWKFQIYSHLSFSLRSLAQRSKTQVVHDRQLGVCRGKIKKTLSDRLELLLNSTAGRKPKIRRHLGKGKCHLLQRHTRILISIQLIMVEQTNLHRLQQLIV